MDRHHAMRIFVAVAENGGFVHAAKLLNMSSPAVTRAIAALEDTIGARLLIRTTRLVRLTPAGQEYLSDCKRILADIAEAEASAAGSYANPAGTLTVTAPTLFGRMYVLPVVLGFLEQYRGVNIHTVFVDRVANLVDEGLDVAVRIGHMPDSGLTAVRVGQVRRVICGSPDYFARNGVPAVPADLKSHSIIGRSGLFGSSEWRFGCDQRISVNIHPRLECNTNDAAIEACRAGWGISRFLSYQVAPDVEAGRLKIILAEYEEEPVPIHIVHAQGRKTSARVRVFVDFAAEKFRSNQMINGHTEPDQIQVL